MNQPLGVSRIFKINDYIYLEFLKKSKRGALLIYDHQLKMQACETSILAQIEQYLKNLRSGKED